jgi:hypothetical protein
MPIFYLAGCFVALVGFIPFYFIIVRRLKYLMPTAGEFFLYLFCSWLSVVGLIGVSLAASIELHDRKMKKQGKL